MSTSSGCSLRNSAKLLIQSHSPIPEPAAAPDLSRRCSTATTPARRNSNTGVMPRPPRVRGAKSSADDGAAKCGASALIASFAGISCNRVNRAVPANSTPKHLHRRVRCLRPRSRVASVPHTPGSQLTETNRCPNKTDTDKCTLDSTYYLILESRLILPDVLYLPSIPPTQGLAPRRQYTHVTPKQAHMQLAALAFRSKSGSCPRATSKSKSKSS